MKYSIKQDALVKKLKYPQNTTGRNMLRYNKATSTKDNKDKDPFQGIFNIIEDVTMEKNRGESVAIPDWAANAAKEGHTAALTFIAGLHLGSQREGKGLAQAKPLLREAAKNGYTHAQMQLGVICLFGLGDPVREEEAARWLCKAADQGEPNANALLGMMFAAGCGVSQDLKEAQRRLELADAKGPNIYHLFLSSIQINLLPEASIYLLSMLKALANVLLRMPDNSSDIELRNCMLQDASQGDPDACFIVSSMYFCGNEFFECDLEKAWSWCQAASEAGHPLASFLLALGYLCRKGQKGDEREAARLLSESVAEDRWLGQFFLGLITAAGIGVEKDLPKARLLLEEAANKTNLISVGIIDHVSILSVMMEHVFRHFGVCLFHYINNDYKKLDKQAALKFLADQGDPFAQFMIGRDLISNQPSEEDRREALHWFRLAADQGLALAEYSLGNAYKKGEGVEPDPTEALRWYRCAAEQGLDLGQYEMGQAYRAGKGVDPDPTEAVRWYQLAAEQGLDVAQFMLGAAYQAGTGVEKNSAEAMRWHRLAAEQGYAFSQSLLAMAYKVGEGVDRDSSEAVHWFRLAAENGLKEAQFHIGLAYEAGDGVEPNAAQAIHWLRHAAENGHKLAQDKLESMDKTAQSSGIL